MSEHKESASDEQGSEGSDHEQYLNDDREQSKADIVDIVLKLMDDGPTPMKNMKPAKKNRTGAEQFYQDHHAEYEARGAASCDRVARVLQHNSACPKMYDELRKRRSTCRPMISQRNLTQAKRDPNSELCFKVKKQHKLENQRKRVRSRRRDLSSRVTKHRRPDKRRSPIIHKVPLITVNKCCQCTSYYLPEEATSVSMFKNCKALPPAIAPTTNVMTLQTFDPTSPHPSRHVTAPEVTNTPPPSNADPKGSRHTSAPSMSSYNSYLSMGHEPMVE